MHIRIDYGQAHLDAEVRDASWIRVERPALAPALADPAAALRDALEAPVGFPALRRVGAPAESSPASGAV